MRTLLLKYILLALAAYIIAGFLVNHFIDRGLFKPPRVSYKVDDTFMLKSTDGRNIAARWLENPGARCAILYSHGNAVDLGGVRYVMEYYHKLGFSVLAYDYQGYGLSEGTPSESHSYDDIKAAYNFLITTKAIPANRIVLMGNSLGTGPTLDLAKRIPPPAAVILQSPYLSAYHVATKYPLFPFNRFENYEKIDRINAPLLIIHGERDIVIPIEHGRELFEKAHAPKNALWIPDGQHIGLYRVAGDEIKAAILAITAACFQ